MNQPPACDPRYEKIQQLAMQFITSIKYIADAQLIQQGNGKQQHDQKSRRVGNVRGKLHRPVGVDVAEYLLFYLEGGEELLLVYPHLDHLCYRGMGSQRQFGCLKYDFF